MNNAVAINPDAPAVSLMSRFAARFNVEPGKLGETLKATAFRTDKGVTNEQLMALVIVADQYGLNPFTKEIYAFPDKGGIVPVVGVDGWARIINQHPQFDGMSFCMAEDGSSYECTIHRKDRSHPTVLTEYLAECKRNTEPWQKWPRRMLRHKAMIQAARLAFGFAGIHDPDEADRIRETRDMGSADEVTRPIDRVRQIARTERTTVEMEAPATPVKKSTAKKAQPAPVATTDPDTGEILAGEPESVPVNEAAIAARLQAMSDIEMLDLAGDELRGLPEGPRERMQDIYRAKREALAT